MTRRQPWTIVSRNERRITIGDRHFFASRCNPRQKWAIEEVNQADPNGSHALAVIQRNMTTVEVSAWPKTVQIEWKTVLDPRTRSTHYQAPFTVEDFQREYMQEWVEQACEHERYPINEDLDGCRKCDQRWPVEPRPVIKPMKPF